MTLLIVGIIVMLGIHLVPTIPDVRDRLIASLGMVGTASCSPSCRPSAWCS